MIPPPINPIGVRKATTKKGKGKQYSKSKDKGKDSGTDDEKGLCLASQHRCSLTRMIGAKVFGGP